MRIWALISALLLVSALEVRAQRVIPDPVRPVRVMQEVPWAVSTSGWKSSMQPVRTLWDQMTETYYVDLLAFFDILDFQTDIDGEIVRSRGSEGVYEIDFERETAVFSVGGIVEYEVEFSEGGSDPWWIRLFTHPAEHKEHTAARCSRI